MRKTKLPLKLGVLLLFLVVAVHAMGQPMQTGVAYYGVRYIDKTKSSDQLPSYVSVSPHTGTIAEQMEFKLSFTPNTATFDYVDKDLKIGERELMMTLAYFDYGSALWQDNGKAYTVTKVGFGEGADEVLLYSDNNADDWTITDESKLIGEYTCIKATKNETRKRRGNVVVVPIVAWFCPELPLPFGPLRHGGLPGLILELQTERALFGLERIEFKDVVLAEMPDLEAVTEEEYLERAFEFIDRIKNRDR